MQKLALMKKGKMMRVCIPTEEDRGIESIIYGHFGSAQYFVICDTETDETKTLENKNQHHAHGTCSPMAALGGESVDSVIVGGIGKGAISGQNNAGIKVYQSKKGTVRDNVEALKNGKLNELTPQNACAGHGHGGGCGN